MSDHTIVIIWVVNIFFVQFFCVFLPPLLNIFCLCQVPTISVLYWAHLCMKYSLGISNFLEEISSLSLSIVFLYFFALIPHQALATSKWWFCRVSSCSQVIALPREIWQCTLLKVNPEAGSAKTVEKPSGHRAELPSACAFQVLFAAWPLRWNVAQDVVQ